MKTRTDNRSLEQVARSIAAMRRRVAAAMRRHEKLQKRIAKLSEQGRIISLSHDSRIVVGIECWYTFSDSLNVDKDAPTNFYYETTWNAQAGYGCSCEAVGDCHHIHELSATFAPIAQPADPRADTVAILVPEGIAIIDKSSLTKHDILATAINQSNQGFSLLRR